jgi:hypothetical protein
VITDYAFMDAYKADTLHMLYRSMEIVSEYTTQVIVLKVTQVIRALSGRCDARARDAAIHRGVDANSITRG